MSARPSTGSPWACSGDMYSGVPITAPYCVCQALDVRTDVTVGRAAPPLPSLLSARGNRRRLRGVRSQELGDAPIHHLHFAEIPDHDVGRLEISMDDGAGV